MWLAGQRPGLRLRWTLLAEGTRACDSVVDSCCGSSRAECARRIERATLPGGVAAYRIRCVGSAAVRTECGICAVHNLAPTMQVFRDHDLPKQVARNSRSRPVQRPHD